MGRGRGAGLAALVRISEGFIEYHALPAVDAAGHRSRGALLGAEAAGHERQVCVDGAPAGAGDLDQIWCDGADGAACSPESRPQVGGAGTLHGLTGNLERWQGSGGGVSGDMIAAVEGLGLGWGLRARDTLRMSLGLGLGVGVVLVVGLCLCIVLNVADSLALALALGMGMGQRRGPVGGVTAAVLRVSSSFHVGRWYAHAIAQPHLHTCASLMVRLFAGLACVVRRRRGVLS